MEAVLDGVREPDGNGGPDDPSRILDRLPDEIEAPFRFVRGAVRHSSYAGSRLGARGVALARLGNSLDQALLLRASCTRQGAGKRVSSGAASAGPTP